MWTDYRQGCRLCLIFFLLDKSFSIHNVGSPVIDCFSQQTAWPNEEHPKAHHTWGR